MKIFNLNLYAPDIIERFDTGKVFPESVAGERIMLARRGPTVDYWEGGECAKA